MDHLPHFDMQAPAAHYASVQGLCSGVGQDEHLALAGLDADYRDSLPVDSGALEIEVAQELDHAITRAMANKMVGQVPTTQTRYVPVARNPFTGLPGTKPLPVEVKEPAALSVSDALQYDECFVKMVDLLALEHGATQGQYQGAVHGLRDAIRARYVRTNLADIVEARGGLS